jgi:hypothetical protein
MPLIANTSAGITNRDFILLSSFIRFGRLQRADIDLGFAKNTRVSVDGATEPNAKKCSAKKCGAKKCGAKKCNIENIHEEENRDVNHERSTDDGVVSVFGSQLEINIRRPAPKIRKPDRMKIAHR